MIRMDRRAALMGTGVFVLLALASCGDERAAVPSPAGEGAHPGAPGSVDPCDAATLSLRALYDTLRQCSASEACQYVDGFYDLVPRTDLDREITEFDCHEPTPFLGVANGSRVQERMTDLQNMKEAQNAACRPPNPDDIVFCEGFRTRLSAPPPVCEAGKCVAPPDL